jgi:hypothetical protein
MDDRYKEVYRVSMFLFTVVCCLLLGTGFTLGYLSKGISINISRPEDEKDLTNYNDSNLSSIDPEQREYFEKFNGNIKV